MTRLPRSVWLLLLSVALSGQLFALSGGINPLMPAEPIRPMNTPFPMPQPLRPVIPNRTFDIREFGAIEGGQALNTDALRRAITTAAQQGGGNVLIPEGRWLTGAIHLESNINLHLGEGAELLFSQNPKDYLPAVFSRHEDLECYKYSAFIYARGKTNIAITGPGTLNGQGKPWWEWKVSKQHAEALLNQMGQGGTPVEERVFDGSGGRELRPAFFQPVECSSVLVEGVTFLYGAFWTITPTYCKDVIVRNVHIVTEGEYGHTPNGDGINPSSSQNVLIENCVFDTGDDCIAIKAGRDNDGLRVNRPTENVVIRDCRGLRGHGGIVIGSETSGGVRNVQATDCTFKGTDRIVRIKTTRGRGGAVENLWFSRLTGEAIAREAIHINMLYTGTRLPAQPVSIATPSVRNVYYADISCTSGAGYAIELLGLPEQPVENVWFSRITASTAKGINLADVNGIRMSEVTLSTPSTPVITITDGADLRFDDIRTEGSVTVLADVSGSRSGNISIATSIPLTAGMLTIGSDVPPNAVTVGPVQRSRADSLPWSRRIAESFLRRHPGGVTYDSLSPDQKWNYEQGLMLVALLEYGRRSGERTYSDFVRANLELYVDSTGSIRTYKLADYNLDNIGPGKALLATYEATHEQKYRRAADSLIRQLHGQPRTNEGGFWHKKIYPYQMWLDGLFMAQPFLARYAVVFDSSAAFDDIADQFIWIDRHTYDQKTGLFYHAWDESRQQRWADPVTGRSPNFWGRAMGWYAMALVDVLDDFPAAHPRRAELVGIFQRLARGVASYQEQSSGLWFQVVDQAGRDGNYREASASLMFAYSFAKGAARGYLDGGYLDRARHAFRGVLDSLVTIDADGSVNLHGTCRGAGLGGNPYRDGSFEYYVGEPRRTNDLKGYGPFLRAAIELERSGQASEKGKL